jgi:5-methylcytosine-specific restriction endonuclease McrA
VTSKKGDPLVSYRWKQLRKRVFAEEWLCWLCGLPCDFKGAPLTPRSPTVDHVIPRSKGGAVYDRQNLRLACFECNTRRGDGTRGQGGRPPSPQSREW